MATRAHDSSVRQPKRAVASAAARPMFGNDMHTMLVQAEAIVQVINTAAYQASGAEGIGGSCWAVAEMLQRVIHYVEASFDTSAKEASHGR